MTVNSIKNNIKIGLIIIGICCLVGFGSVVMGGSISGAGGKLISCEEDNRISDVNYLDMPADDLPAIRQWQKIVLEICIIVCISCLGLLIVCGAINMEIVMKFWQNFKKY